MKIGASSSSADFDHPLEMLSACHERIEDRLRTLERLLEHLPGHGADEQARQAAAGVLRYFDTAGEHHHQDEEGNLFPALRERATDPAMLALLEDLQHDHDRMRVLWAGLRERLTAIASGASGALDPALVAEFNATYREHIAREDSQLLPRAEGLLEADEKMHIGQAMARRRGVKN